MLFTYDPILVIISVIVSIVGAYTCFDLVIKIRRNKQFVNKKLLVGAAFTIGGSIWAMHFIAMMAVNLPIVIRYDLLTTVISGLVSVFMTAAALLIVSTASYSLTRILVAGIVMGAGISSMHYVGMSAIRGNCELSFSIPWVTISVVIGMVASSASLWIAMNLHGVWRRLSAALVMGISISGVHYTGMLGTAFLPLNKALEFTQPALSPFSLGLVTAIATFIILGLTLLTLVPTRPTQDSKDQQTANTAVANADNSVPDVNTKARDPSVNYPAKLPVQKYQKTFFIKISDIVSVTADGHYTTLRTGDGEEHFCNYSLSRVEDQLDANVFFRAHRSHLVNLNYIESFERKHDKGFVTMQGNDQVLPISRSNIEKLRKLLGV